MYALNWDRQVLYERINKRVDIMIEQGLIEEVKKIYTKYDKFPTAMQGLGYKEVVEYLEDIELPEMTDFLEQQTGLKVTSYDVCVHHVCAACRKKEALHIF